MYNFAAHSTERQNYNVFFKKKKKHLGNLNELVLLPRTPGSISEHMKSIWPSN